MISPPQTIYDQCSKQEGNASYAGARLPMDERWYPQFRERTEDERCFVDEHERAVRYSRKACSQLLMRLQSEGPDPYAVVIPVRILSRIPIRILSRIPRRH